MTDIHKGGRPPIDRPNSFYRSLLDAYETSTIKQISESYGVSRVTISRWLKIARDKRANGWQE